MKTIFCLIFLTIIFAPCFSQSTDLFLRLEKDKEYKQNMSSKVTVISDVNGEPMKIVMTIGGSMTFLVKDISGSNYKMEAKFDKLSMSMKMPESTIEFNSDKNDPNDILSTIFGMMKGKTFEITMTKTGKVSEIKNVEILYEAAIKQFEQLSETQKEQIKVQIAKAYGSDALKGNIEMSTSIYPDKPVVKGDKWSLITSLESGMSAKMNTSYELIELTSEYALIKGVSTIATADKDAYIETNGMPMRYDLTGTMISEIKVDKNTGWIIEAKINQEIKGDTYIKENPQLPNGLKVPMVMSNEMLITN